MVECEIFPSMLKTKDNKLFILLHVDDLLVTGHADKVQKQLIPALQSAYKILYSIMKEMGDELTFLKRRRILAKDRLLLIKSHQQHVAQLKEIVDIHPKAYPKKTPAHPAIDNEDTISKLKEADLTKFRSAVGILLFLAADLPHCQHCIRFLATKMTSATQHCWQVLKHLVLYLSGNQDLCLSLNFKGDRSGLFHDYTANEHAIVEKFTDADWASCKDDRRSISACAIFYGGCLLHSSSRTQKIVSLSSAESEMYAAASGACDSVLIVGILKWMFDAFFQIHLYLDSAAARGIINRRGVGKVRHLSCRSLRLQERMADGSLVVSPVSGTTSPADIGAKRPNVNRMKGLMFLLGMFDRVNSCHLGETEANSIIHHQEIRKAMQSVRRLVKCEDSPLQILVLMSALGLARGQGNADQSTSFDVGSWWMTATCTVFAFVLGGIFIWIMNFKKVEPNMNDAATQAGEGGEEDDDDESIPEESDQERHRRYLSSEMTEVSDPDLWMNLHHHSDEDGGSEENAEEAELDTTQLRILQALDSDDDCISNPAIAMWLLARLDRRIAETDETTRAAYFPLADGISTAIRNLRQGDTSGNPADLRRALRQFCILSPRELSPTNSLTPDQIGEEIVQNCQNYNMEFMNTDGDGAEEIENTNQPEAEAEPIPEGEEGVRVPAHLYFENHNPMYGPLTQVDSQIQEIHDRRAENLAILDERYENAYINGDQEEIWAIEAQMDWWTNVLIAEISGDIYTAMY